MTPPPACIHGLTIRKATKPATASRIEITLPYAEAQHFQKGTKVVLALESDPTVQVRSEVQGAKPAEARRIEIPRSHAEAQHFPNGTKVVLALESDPTVQVRSAVWGAKRRYVVIRRKQENSNRFLIGTDVMLMLDAEAV